MNGPKAIIRNILNHLLIGKDEETATSSFSDHLIGGIHNCEKEDSKQAPPDIEKGKQMGNEKRDRTLGHKEKKEAQEKQHEDAKEITQNHDEQRAEFRFVDSPIGRRCSTF